MPQPRPDRRQFLIVIAILLSLGVLALDFATPPGAMPSMLYVLVVLHGLWIPLPWYPTAAAGVTTLFLALDLATNWSTPPPQGVYMNWPILTLIIWATAAFVNRFHRMEANAVAGIKQLSDLKYALDQAAIVATTDVSGRITYVNDKFCEISHYSRDELLGQDHRIVNSGLHPKAFIKELWRTIANGHVWHGELRNKAKNGEFYWVDTTIVPFVDERGRPYQYIAIRNDITQSKAAEARLRDQAALARVGQMAAVVAHEVKNPLAGIKGAMQVILSRRPAGDAEVPVMHDIVHRIDALNDLIQDLLLYSRPRPLRRTPLDLHPLLEEALTQMRRDPAAAKIVTELLGASASLSGDPDLLRATFLNLFLNAAQAMGGQGTLRVTLTTDDANSTITIADTGPGIPAEIRDRVFEPFFTTKSRGGGLGLAIARRTIELHGGTIALDCPAEGGTVMTVVLPRVSFSDAGATVSETQH